ncbi:hypothetical protein LOK49_LG09G02499 [Camellia lanceoleosa]|uniref:Uncharacterized protein n=1 Tax=Camellia lanceoleosa TaxID=1840588 RepID=A0ACC0GFU4_9ERIC|nr:hypothetical protein LOK49_LG09G02499 [Camellia lanceoleosa]
MLISFWVSVEEGNLGTRKRISWDFGEGFTDLIGLESLCSSKWYKGTYCSQEVAIKVLKLDLVNKDMLREFAQEVFIMRREEEHKPGAIASVRRSSVPMVKVTIISFKYLVAAFMKKGVDSQIPNYPNLPSKLLCLLHNVTLHADLEMDEVYAQMTLQPVPSFDKDALLRSDLSMKANKPQTEFFCKTLTASDTSTHGGFSIELSSHIVRVYLTLKEAVSCQYCKGRCLGMGTNMYPSSALLGQNKDESISALPVDELIEKADGFAGVFPEHKYEIVRCLQARKHICGMTGDGVNDAPALKKADIGIAVADATDAARSASDIGLTEPGLSVIISAVLTSRAIFQRMKNYTIYAVSITIRIVLGFMLLALIWRFDFPPFMVLIIAILNDGPS